MDPAPIETQQSVPVQLREVPRAPALDLRVVFANERTLLAWVRTAIGLMAFGFVVARAGVWVKLLAGDVSLDTQAFRWIGTGLVVLAVASLLIAWRAYHRARRALLEGRDEIPDGRPAAILSSALLAVGVVLVVLLVAV